MSEDALSPYVPPPFVSQRAVQLLHMMHRDELRRAINDVTVPLTVATKHPACAGKTFTIYVPVANHEDIRSIVDFFTGENMPGRVRITAEWVSA